MASNYKSVEKNAFLGQTTITAVSFGKDCKTVGESAFGNCSELSDINVDNEIITICSKAFTHTSIINVTFNSVETIGNSAFEGCKCLKYITINNGCSFIGDYAFKDCETLTSVDIPNNENFKTISNGTFQNCSIKEISIPKHITIIGSNAFNGCGNLSSVIFDPGSQVTNIGNFAFRDCSSITEISIPNTTTNIGYGAFYECKSLTSVMIGTSVRTIQGEAFNGCIGLTNINIPNSVTTIEKEAFARCSGLTTISIGSGVTTIGSGAFLNCNKLKNVYTNDITSWCNIDFTNIKSNPLHVGGNLCLNNDPNTKLNITLPSDGVKKYAFYNCKNISNITIPNEFTSDKFGTEAFHGVVSHRVINLSNAITVTSNHAENGCVGEDAQEIINAYNGEIQDDIFIFGQKSQNKDSDWALFKYLGTEEIYNSKYKDGLIFPDKYYTYDINEGVFKEHTEIKKITIPTDVTSIGNYTFTGCSNLNTLTIEGYDYDNSDSEIDDTKPIVYKMEMDGSSESDIETPLKLGYNKYSSNYQTEGEGLFKECNRLEELNLGRNISYKAEKKYGYSPFSGISSLKTVNIGVGVTDIKDNMFYKCGGITSMKIGDSVKSIGADAFSGCSGLTRIDIPESVTSIGDDAFSYCSNLKEVHIKNIAAWCNINFENDDANPIVFSKKLYLNGNLVKDNLIIPDGVENINKYVFCNYYHISNITIPNSVTSIGEGAFESCYYEYEKVKVGLTKIFFDNDSKLETIGNYAFNKCNGLTNIIIPNSVKSIGDGAFGNHDRDNVSNKNINSHQRIVIGNNVENIGDYAFNRNSNSIIIIGKNDKNINFRDNSFYYDDPTDSTSFRCIINFSNMNIENNISSYGKLGYNCNNIKNIPDAIQNGDFMFNRVHDDYNDTTNYIYTLCGYIGYGNGELYLNDSINWNGNISFEKYNIGEYVFSNCDMLEKITIPNNITEIQNYAFLGCKSLKYLNIEDGEDELKLGINDLDFYNYGLFKDCSVENIYLGRNIIFDTTDNFTGSPFGDHNTSLKNVIIGNSVTKIGSNDFRNCTGIKHVIIGKNVDDIDEYSFENCDNHIVINFSNYINTNDKNTEYYYNLCDNAKEILNYSSYDSIKEGDFIFATSDSDDHSTILCIYFGDDIECKMPDYYIPNNYKNENIYYFYNFIENIKNFIYTREKIKYDIEYGAFYGCDKLTNVILGNMVTKIGNNAFEDCYSIYNETIYNKDDDRYENIEKKRGLKSINIHNRVEYIGHNVFDGCNELEFVIFGKNVTTDEGQYIEDIMGSSFEITDPDIVKLKKIINFSKLNTKTNSYLNDKVINVYNYNNDKIEGFNTNDDEYVLITSDGFIFTKLNGVETLCGYCGNNSEFTLPSKNNNVNAVYEINNNYIIGDFAFYENTNITNVTIPNNVTNIGSSAFEAYYDEKEGYYNSSLESVTIGKNVTNIGTSAFYGCGSLEMIEIPNSVTHIEDWAFGNCSLKSVTFKKNSKLTNISNYMFCNNYDLEEIEIPDSVTSIGDFAFFGDGNTESLLKKVIISENSNITNIGECAFYGCNKLETINIPDSVTSIGEGAFGSDYDDMMTPIFENADPDNDHIYYIGKVLYRCFATDNITIKYDTLGIAGGAFRDNTDITSITIPNNVTNIGKNAFNGCSNLEEITIGTNVTSIGAGAFKGCNELKRIINLSNVKISKDLIPNENVVIINSSNFVTTEDGFTFAEINGVNILCGYMGNATKLSLPKNYNEKNYVIGDDAFKNNLNITNVTIPNSVTSIGNGAFYNCDYITQIIFEENSVVESIGNYTFYGCGRLTDIIIPNSVTNIGENAFENCVSLINVTIPDSVTNIGNSAFYKCRDLENINLPNNIIDIGNHIFFDCGSLKNITIPNNVETIGDYVFGKCFNITNITIPESVTSIGKGAFSGTSIVEINIPQNIVDIEDFTFNNCKSLKEITIRSPHTMVTIGKNVFNNSIYQQITIYVPTNIKSNYILDAGWNSYSYINFSTI